MCPFPPISFTASYLYSPTFFVVLSTTVNASSLKRERETPHLHMYVMLVICVEYLYVFLGSNEIGEEAYSPENIFLKTGIYLIQGVS